MSAEVVEKPKAKRVKRKKSDRKLYHLKDFYGCFKGKIFCDDAIFNLGVRA